MSENGETAPNKALTKKLFGLHVCWSGFRVTPPKVKLSHIHNIIAASIVPAMYIYIYIYKMFEKNTISIYLSTYLSIGSICMYPPPLPSPRLDGVAPPIPGRLPLPPPARHRIQPSACFAPACHLQNTTDPLAQPAAVSFHISHLLSGRFGSAMLLRASFATAHTCQSLTAAPAHPSIHVLFKTKRPTLPAPPSPCPLHGFHATKCYPCFYTTLPDFLTVSEQPFVTFGSEAPCLPARPCKGLAL